jgi:signal transduction histidine kinase
VQQIVHAHTGDISVEENAGGGACFRLHFPHVPEEYKKDPQL